MMNRLIVLIFLLLMVTGCGGTETPVEVTRLVTEQVPVTVEVTRLVVQEVAVEVTRLVELQRPTAIPTSEPAVETASEEAIEPTAEPTIEPTATTAVSGAVYVIQPGDTLATIAEQTGHSIAAIQAANGMDDSTFLIAGQELIIPGAEGDLPPIQPPAPEGTEAPAEAPVEEPPPAAVVAGSNLLPNPSFEGEWYFSGFQELQVPDGWQLTTDEGANTLPQGAGGLFNRPEVRVISVADVTSEERGLFIFEGNKTVKAFKGGAPTSFSMFTDVTLPPGSYRLTIQFFPDTVAGYDGNQKIFASDPIAAEAALIVDSGGTGWQGTTSGQRNALVYDFTLEEGRTVRVGGSFRNRFIMNNNGWFIDAWSLTPLSPG